jgi:hypothetical protein
MVRALHDTSRMQRILLASAIVLSLGRAAHAEIGWEVEWDVELTQVSGDGTGAPADAETFWIKETLGREGNWLITSDDVWDRVTCPPEILALFPAGTTQGIRAYARDDDGKTGAAKTNKCFKGIIEFKSQVPLVNQAGIQTDMNDLRALIQRWLTDPLPAPVARVGAAPLPGLANVSGPAGNGGCANAFPCVLRFPVYANENDAINQVNAVPNHFWYVVIKSANVTFRPQVNLNVPLTYFSQPGSPNGFVNAQFQELWQTTTPWTFAPIKLHSLTPERRAFYRLYGFYARKMDELAKAQADMVYIMTKVRPSITAPIEANKNKLNPNVKFDFCELRAAIGVTTTYIPLKSYFGPTGSVHAVVNATPIKMLGIWPYANCRFTSKDVTLRPFLFNGVIRPLFEFRHPGANQPCFDLTTWVANGTGNLAALAQQCDIDSTVF